MFKDQISKLVETHPKHFSQIIKRNSDLMEAVNEYPGQNISEKVFVMLYGYQDLCPSGNRKKFKSIKDGYTNCASAGKCECARLQVSQSVALSKSKVSDSSKADSLAKRINTNLHKYGVTNTGQLNQAKEKHQAFYLDAQAVSEVTAKIKKTKLEKYKNPNYNNSEKIKKTWQNKHQHFIDLYPEKNIAELRDEITMKGLYDLYSINEIADIMSVSCGTVTRWLTRHGLRTKFKSSLEKEMINYLNSIGVDNLILNSRSLLGNKKELDIFLPDFDIAIEMNGIYWHHDQIDTIDKWSHYIKKQACDAKGIELIAIFSDEWDNKKDIIKQMIAHKLVLSKDERVYARNTKIKEVSSKDSSEFLNLYHIQGNTGSTFRYGLYNKINQLVAVMTFSKPRLGIGKHRRDNEDMIELVRYASSVQVVGGASKLLKHFLKNHPSIKHVISYSNNEYGSGGLYQTLGFKQDKKDSLGYFYYSPKENKRYHRYSFTKHSLVQKGADPNKTEYEIMMDMGYLRVWDYGKRVWKLDIRQ
jgi:hypothetical protein